MNIRIPNIEDFDDILRLQVQLDNTELVFDTNLKDEQYSTDKGKEKLRNRINDKNIIFYVVTDESNKIIAFIDGSIPDDEWWYKEKVAYINHLCVDEKYRRQGIAKILLKEFEKVAKENDAKYIRLLAFPNNKPAISCYKNNGFSEYSTYYSKKINF